MQEKKWQLATSVCAVWFTGAFLYECLTKTLYRHKYRSGTVNSKSFVGKVLLRIKRKFELTYAL